jgi:hypothetical protein
MKLLHTLFIGFALVCSYTVTAQTGNIDNPECVARYEKLKELHLQKLTSESYVKQHVLLKEFTRKLNVKDAKYKVAEMSKDMLGWIKTNIDKTLFESYEEAEKDFAALSAAGEASRIEGREYFSYMKECAQHCGNDILYRVNEEVFAEHPELLEVYK